MAKKEKITKTTISKGIPKLILKESTPLEKTVNKEILKTILSEYNIPLSTEQEEKIIDLLVEKYFEKLTFAELYQNHEEILKKYIENSDIIQHLIYPIFPEDDFDVESKLICEFGIKSKNTSIKFELNLDISDAPADYNNHED